MKGKGDDNDDEFWTDSSFSPTSIIFIKILKGSNTYRTHYVSEKSRSAHKLLMGIPIIITYNTYNENFTIHIHVVTVYYM